MHFTESDLEDLLLGEEDCNMGRVYKIGDQADWHRIFRRDDRTDRFLEQRKHDQYTKKMIMHFHQDILAPCCVKGLCIIGD
jgi:hypothetical protein